MRPTTSNFRSIVIVSIAAILIMGLMVWLGNSTRVKGDASDPLPPTEPTINPTILAGSEATKDAEDALDESLAVSSLATEAVKESLGISDKDTVPPTLAPEPIETEEAATAPTPANGIERVQSADSSWIRRYHISNEWIGTISGNRVSIIAGSKADVVAEPSVWNNPEQGVLIYDSWGQGTDGEYLTSARHGALKLTDSNGTCLSISASDGTTYVFDADTREWSCTSTSNP